MSRTRKSALLALALCGAQAVLGSCSDETPPAPPARFNRPNRVDFVCVNVKPSPAAPVVLPLEACRCVSADPAMQRLPMCAEIAKDVGPRDRLSMHALVTQTGRGEIGVVNLRARQVLDSRRDIPGYTFVPIGETPTAIIAPPVHSAFTYVADFGSRDVRVLRTLSLVATVAGSPEVQRVPLSVDGGQTLLAPTDMVLAPDESALFAAVPDAGLVLRLPIVRCDGTSSDCVDGRIDEAAITAVDVREPSVPAPPPPAEHAAYEELCGFERKRPTSPDGTELPVTKPIVLAPNALDVSPRPSALALDAFCRADEPCTPRLLVADTAQPVIHVIDLDAWAGGNPALLTPLITGVPTNDVVVTPHVPRDVNGDGETQYVYATDAGDGSVLVLEDGELLNVNAAPGQRPDRLALSAKAGARALEVITPGFKVAADQVANQHVAGATDQPVPGFAPNACTDETYPEQDPARLRGVFLTAALTDGTVHVIDIHDMELRADGGGKPCRPCAQDPSVPLLERHQERIGISFTPPANQPRPSFVPAVTTLAYSVDNVFFNVRADGTSASPRAPGLQCMACDGDLTRAFPLDDSSGDATGAGGTSAPSEDDGGVEVDGGLADAGMSEVEPEDPLAQLNLRCEDPTPALLCVADDPWSSGEDFWSAIFEGLLPGMTGSYGSFVPPPDDPSLDGFVPAEGLTNETGGLELLTNHDSCRAGVLGEDDMEPDYAGCPEDDVPDDLAGDQVVILSRPLGRKGLEALGRGSEQVIEACAALSRELEANAARHVAFEIRRAYRDRLVVHSTLVRAVGDARTFADVARCYEDKVAFDVRVNRAFAVIGGNSGFQHHVRANAAGRCQVDPNGDPLARGRARLGCSFRNHSLQFQLPRAERTDDVQRIGVSLLAAFSSRAAKVVLRAYNLGFGTATVVPEQLRYNDVDGRLFLVDIYQRGLLPIPLDPFEPSLSTSGQFN